MRISRQPVCQPLAMSSPICERLRRFGVEMERLRVPVAREFDDLFGA